MIPKIDEEVNELLGQYVKLNTIGSSYTYKMQIDKDRIYDFVDGAEALKQAIYKRLNTERDVYPIYKNYGIKKKDLFGKEKRYAYMILTDRIKDTLLEDDRINEVRNFEYIDEKSRKDNVCISFDVDSVFGVINVEEVINLA